MGREREHRLRIAGAERPGPLEILDEGHRRPARAERGVDPQIGQRPRDAHLSGQRLAQMRAERAELPRLQCDARRHRVTAAARDDPGLYRGDHRMA